MTTAEVGVGRVEEFVVGGGVVRCWVGGSGGAVVVLPHSFGGVGWSGFVGGWWGRGFRCWLRICRGLGVRLGRCGVGM